MLSGGLAGLSKGFDTDEELVSRAGRGDRVAAGLLIERHTDKVMAVCYRMLGERSAAEDAAQETFLRLWKNAPGWRAQGAGFEAWLYRVAKNICLDRLRRRGREAPQDAAPEQIDAAPHPDAAVMTDQRRLEVDAALAILPERQRLAVTLCYYQELSNGAAASIMGVSVEAIESLLGRARRRLRERLSSRRAELMEGP